MLKQTRRNGKLSTDNHQEIRPMCNWSPGDHNSRIQHQELDFDFPHLQEIRILRAVLKNNEIFLFLSMSHVTKVIITNDKIC